MSYNTVVHPSICMYILLSFVLPSFKYIVFSSFHYCFLTFILSLLLQYVPFFQIYSCFLFLPFIIAFFLSPNTLFSYSSFFKYYFHFLPAFLQFFISFPFCLPSFTSFFLFLPSKTLFLPFLPSFSKYLFFSFLPPFYSLFSSSKYIFFSSFLSSNTLFFLPLPSTNIFSFPYCNPYILSFFLYFFLQIHFPLPSFHIILSFFLWNITLT